MASAAPGGEDGGVMQFGKIFLGQRGAVSQGNLKVTPQGLAWKRTAQNKPSSKMDIKREEIAGLFWTKVTRGCQLGVRVKDSVTFNFVGFKESDREALQAFSKQHYGMGIESMVMSTAGRNWGGVAINGKSLMFLVDGKPAFEVPLPDVVSAQQAKDDIMLEFNVDDTASDEREDLLAEMAFHVPQGHRSLVPSNEGEVSAKALLDQVLAHTDTLGASSDAPIARFDDVPVLAPRGRFEVEMFHSHVTLSGQTQDYKIRYASIQRIFILPKSATPHTLVVISLDPAIRKGQTYYTHVLCQFPSEEDASINLDITPEALAAKNEKCGGKLEASMSGPACEVFARALRGLSAAKITRPGTFRNATGDGHAVRCSYKADDGYLYPLDRAFFYVHKPPMLIPFEEVESVELTRLGGNAVSSRTFDLVVRTRSDAEHQFRGIQRSEWQVLLDFFQAKKLRVERLRETQAGPGRAGAGLELGGDDDEDGQRGGLDAGEEDEEDDEDFVGGSEGSSSGGSDDDSGSGSAEMVEEDGISAKAMASKSKKRKQASEDDEDGGDSDEEEEKPAKKSKAAAKKEKGEGAKKAPKKKKDPNAPKKNVSSYMFFNNEMRAKVKEENPGASFGELAKLVSERWKNISADEKARFDKMAEEDKERFKKAEAIYKSGGGAGGGGGGEDEGGEEEVEA